MASQSFSLRTDSNCGMNPPPLGPKPSQLRSPRTPLCPIPSMNSIRSKRRRDSSLDTEAPPKLYLPPPAPKKSRLAPETPNIYIDPEEEDLLEIQNDTDNITINNNKKVPNIPQIWAKSQPNDHTSKYILIYIIIYHYILTNI